MTTTDHTHVWGPLARSHFAGTVHRKCLVAGCDWVNAYDDPDEFCHQCGAPFGISDDGTANHLSATEPTGIDHDADEDHVAYSLSEDDS